MSRAQVASTEAPAVLGASKQIALPGLDGLPGSRVVATPEEWLGALTPERERCQVARRRSGDAIRLGSLFPTCLVVRARADAAVNA